MPKVTEPEVTKREVGEQVKLAMSIDSASTKDLGDGVIEATITTSSVDRMSESIQTTGIDTSSYIKTGGVVLYGHDYESLPIGKTIKLTEMKNKIKARFQLAVEELPFAATVYELIKGGYLNAVSIGGIVKEWSDDYRTIIQMEMVEFSVVPVPANAEAIITSRSLQEVTGKDIEEIRTEFQELVQLNMVDKFKDMHDDDISKGIEFLEKLISTLKESHKANSSAGEAEPEVRHIKKVRVLTAAKAVNQESERVIRLIKIKP